MATKAQAKFCQFVIAVISGSAAVGLLALSVYMMVSITPQWLPIDYWLAWVGGVFGLIGIVSLLPTAFAFAAFFDGLCEG